MKGQALKRLLKLKKKTIEDKYKTLSFVIKKLQ